MNALFAVACLAFGVWCPDELPERPPTVDRTVVMKPASMRPAVMKPATIQPATIQPSAWPEEWDIQPPEPLATLYLKAAMRHPSKSTARDLARQGNQECPHARLEWCKTAVSSAGAIGPVQLLPKTARELGGRPHERRAVRDGAGAVRCLVSGTVGSEPRRAHRFRYPRLRAHLLQLGPGQRVQVAAQAWVDPTLRSDLCGSRGDAALHRGHRGSDMQLTLILAGLAGVFLFGLVKMAESRAVASYETERILVAAAARSKLQAELGERNAALAGDVDAHKALAAQAEVDRTSAQNDAQSASERVKALEKDVADARARGDEAAAALQEARECREQDRLPLPPRSPSA